MLTSYFQAFFYDENQSYLRCSPRKRSRSFVQGFLKLHHAILSTNTETITATDIDGSAQSVNTPSFFSYFHTFLSSAPGRGGHGMASEGGTTSAGTNVRQWSSSTNNGIVVGTGTTAVAPTDYQLATQILDGITSGTLEHFTCAGTNFVSAAPTASFDMERLFRNSSGGSITINEVGLYCAQSREATSTTLAHIHHFCIIRDLVSPGFVVLNGEYMRIVYTISVTA